MINTTLYAMKRLAERWRAELARVKVTCSSASSEFSTALGKDTCASELQELIDIVQADLGQEQES